MFLPCIRFSSRPTLRAALSSAERSISERSSSGVKSSSFRKLRPCIAFTAAGASLLSTLISPPSGSIYVRPPGGIRLRSKALDKSQMRSKAAPPAGRSPVFGDGFRLGHARTLRPVDGDAHQQRDTGQNKRGPVRQCVFGAGVARVPDEQDREHKGEGGHDCVACKPRGLKFLAVGPSPLQLGQRGE